MAESDKDRVLGSPRLPVGRTSNAGFVPVGLGRGVSLADADPRDFTGADRSSAHNDPPACSERSEDAPFELASVRSNAKTPKKEACGSCISTWNGIVFLRR
jgi:hypothetical protein